MEDNKKLIAALFLLLLIFIVLFSTVSFLYIRNKRILETRLPRPDIRLESKDIKLFVPEEIPSRSLTMRSKNLAIKPVEKDPSQKNATIPLEALTPESAYDAPAGAPFEEVTIFDIQQALKNAGYDPGAIDGKAGPLTKRAIKSFQRDHNLVADGVAGRKTWEKLYPYLKNPR